MTNDMQTAMQLADQASRASDRWLFIFVLILLGVFALMAMRYLVKQNEALVVEIKADRNAYAAKLETIIKEQAEQQRATVAALTSNTDAVRTNTTALGYMNRRLEIDRRLEPATVT